MKVLVLFFAWMAIACALWPLPASYTVSEDTVILCTPFKFQQMGTLNPILAKAFTRYTALIFGTSQDLARAPAGCVGALTVTLQDQTGTSLSVSTDESYTLDVSSGAVNVFAQNVFGALRALETFSQLVSQTNNQFSAVGASVQDSPRFHWRGLMIDTARHYLSVNTITKLLDAMSYSKLNVLHWHLGLFVCLLLLTAQSMPSLSLLLYQTGLISLGQVHGTPSRFTQVNKFQTL